MESSTTVILSSEQLLPKEHLAMSRDVSDYRDVKGQCARRRGCASGILWVEAMDVNKLSAMKKTALPKEKLFMPQC